MKQITLTDQEANRLDTYFIMTGNRVAEELKIWERLKDDKTAPAAESNLRFWKETRDLIKRITDALR